MSIVRPTIVQTSVNLSIVPVEDSAGGFPGSLDGAAKTFIIGNHDSSFINTITPLAQMPTIAATGDSNFAVSGQGDSIKLIPIGLPWGDSSIAYLDSATVHNSVLFDSDTLTDKMSAHGISTSGNLDATSLTTLVTSTYTPLHRMTLDGHSSGTVADTGGRNWSRSRGTTTVGGKTVVDTNQSYNFGYLSGSAATWPQNFTIFAYYYNRTNADDYWYNQGSSYHFLKIENTSTAGTGGRISLGGYSTYAQTGAKVKKDTWQRIIITAAADGTSTGSSTQYKVYIDGKEEGSVRTTGAVGRNYVGSSYPFAYSSYATGYFLELGAINSVLSASEIAHLDAHLQHRFNGSTTKTTNEIFNDSDRLQYSSIGARFDSSKSMGISLPVFRNTKDSNYRTIDNSRELARIKISKSSSMFRETAPVLQKTIIISDSGGSTFIDEVPREVSSQIAGDSAIPKGIREHFHHKIVGITPANDPRLAVVPDAGGGGGGSSGPAQSWS